ncbi:AtpZ/AtpI family protein [Devosia sp. ZB163]|uniref:AtpZ/AtpI family protein n=1 Tax=Devosia sp. ZB163 TaxID=3025938 RepID=UPI00235EA5C3|nr:AtpZ/AtpI family protein [Devosia sp. ZB163]MDC9823649.1 AtpZ/AtpI family protein [Devosia sp. ZB163]
MKAPRKTERPVAGKKAGSLTSDLKARIERARAEKSVAGDDEFRSATRDMSALSRGLRLGSEFVAAILVGAGLGFLLDQWLHTSPWLFLVMVMLGFAAGVLNVVRSAAEMNKAVPPPTDAPRAPDETEE